MMPAWIAPSILSADFARLGAEVDAVVSAGADLIHFDVMDNHYVPNLTIGPMACEALRGHGVKAPIDVHLMVRPVDRIVPEFAAAGATFITFHPEATEHVDRTIALIREHGCRPGLVFNPATPLDYLDYTLELLVVFVLVVGLDGARGLRGGGWLRGHDDRPRLHLRPCVEDDDGLAGGAQQPLLLEDLEHTPRHLARATDQARELLPAHLDLHAFRVGHGVRLAAQVHDRVGYAPGDVDEGEIAQLAVGAVEARRELRGELEHEPGALGGDLAETRISHLGELALIARADPGAARRLLVEQAHLAEELPEVEVGQHQLVAFLVLDHHFHRAADDVVEHVGQVAGVYDHGLGRHRADAAIAQEPVDRRNLAQGLDVLFHTGSPEVTKPSRRRLS